MIDIVCHPHGRLHFLLPLYFIQLPLLLKNAVICLVYICFFVCVYVFIYVYVYDLRTLLSEPKLINVWCSLTPFLSRSPSLQYSEKALYNQLCFYKCIFDWDHAVSKALQPEEKSKSRLPLRLEVTHCDFICRVTCANSLTDNVPVSQLCILTPGWFMVGGATFSIFRSCRQFSSKINTQRKISNQWLNINLSPQGYTYNIPW